MKEPELFPYSMVNKPIIRGSEIQAEEGRKTLTKWRKENPDKLSRKVSHGATAKSVCKRYTDLRTVEGQRLKAVLDAITDDLGGPENVNAGQQVLLGSLQAKLIVLWQISDYLDTLNNIVDGEGKLVACAGQNFLSYAESIRRDLEALYGFQRGRKTKVPTIEELVKRTKEAQAE